MQVQAMNAIFWHLKRESREKYIDSSRFGVSQTAPRFILLTWFNWLNLV